jgi:hypothetical protein
MQARRQRCSARISDGSRPCQRWAIDGSNVCATHGGRAPQVKKSAKERLAELVEPALKGLNRALRSNDLPTIVRASQIVLDRCGFHPKQTIEVSVPNGSPIPAGPAEEELIDIEKLSVPVKMMILAELKGEPIPEKIYADIKRFFAYRPIPLQALNSAPALHNAE